MDNLVELILAVDGHTVAFATNNVCRARNRSCPPDASSTTVA